MAPDWLGPQLLTYDGTLLGVATLVNAIVTFWGALAIALLAARISGSARVAKFILLTPWLRVVWDVLRGATENAYVLSDYAGSKGALGSFQLGFGARIVPMVQVHLHMQGGDHRYGYSFGDMVAHGLYRHAGATLLTTGIWCVLLVSVSLLIVRAQRSYSWRALLRRAEAMAGRAELLQVGPRQVRVLVPRDHRLGPCTSGLLRPRIWLPSALDAGQRRAALEHELGHVRDADVLWFTVVGVLADIFWFIPGARFLERRLRDVAEQAADARALQRGIAPKALAETILAQAAAPAGQGMLARLGGTAKRIERRLLALSSGQQRRRRQTLLRAVGAAAFTGSVFLSAFGGYS